ncbi:MAG: Fe-S cluster assembly protein SufB [Candidatus Aminicenantia bacterium]
MERIEKMQEAYKDEFLRVKKGLSKEIVEKISAIKGEPDWMREKRLQSLEIFLRKPMPSFGPDLSILNFDELTYYVKPVPGKKKRWEDLPENIRETYEKLGIPEAEKKYLAGVVAQYQSEVVYASLKEQLESMGVIFTDMDTAVKEYPELVKEYFMTKCVPPHDNKFSALHGAVWSGGSFIYVPPGVNVPFPLQSYFSISSALVGQFEHTLIIADKNSFIHYVEGCTAPVYSEHSLHAAAVEIFIKEGARVRYTTIQNWSKNVYNLNTKRAIVEKNGIMEWVGGSIGSGVTMLYPASVLIGEGARAEHLNLTFAGKGQIKDTGSKVIHIASNTSSVIVSKSISKDGGKSTYRGLVKVLKGASNTKVSVSCQSLILDEYSKADTIPIIEIHEDSATVTHEATAGKISEEKLFYLMSRGLTEQDATALIVRGFIEPISKELPMEYAVELNRLVKLEMEGAIG